ncbi:MAG: LLM class flavin-dependent oxidoreductase, partial [Acidimicrobiales bacterium]|nr:LLM class flavin-dependent oxidoreductase [Acidimicrobiales bacterium]
MKPLRVSVQASPRDRASWLALAVDVEAAGFAGLYVSDHPGSGPAPFVALAAAAAVTERIQLGTCVLNAGVWEPMRLATEVATLDVVSGGRAVLGVGAGHTPSEWTSTGRPYPLAAERVDRMEELVTLT